MQDVSTAGGFDLRRLVGEPTGPGPIKVNCPSVDHQDDTASCAVYPDHLFCYGCGLMVRGRDAGRFLRQDLAHLQGRAYLEALGKACYTAHIAKPRPRDLTAIQAVAAQAHRDVPGDKAALDWWKSRGFGTPQVEQYNLGATAHAYTIPLYDRDGHFWGLKYRRRRNGIGPKYWSPQGQPGGLFVPPVARTRSDVVVLCEGELDALLLDSLGYPAVSHTAGCQADPARFLTSWDLVVLAYDMDEPGNIAAVKLLATYSWMTGITWNPDYGKDWGELLKNGHLAEVRQDLDTVLGRL